MTSVIRDFKEMDKNAKRYLGLNMAASPFMIVMDMAPVYLLLIGLHVAEIGSIFTAGLFFSAILTYFVGKGVDKVNVNIGITICYIFFAIYCFFYSIAIGTFMLMAIIAAQVSRYLVGAFIPALSVYQHDAYSPDKREKLLTYHLIAPEIPQLLLFPFFGILLGILYPTPSAFRVTFLICGLGFIIVALLPLLYLPRVTSISDVDFLEIRKLKFTSGLKLITINEIVLLWGFEIATLFVWVNFIISELHGSFFDVVLVELAISIAVILVGLYIKDIKKEYSIKIILAGLALFAISYFFMLFALNIWVVIGVLSIATVANTIWFPFHNSMLYHFIPEKRRGEYFGLINGLKKITIIPLPLVAGFLAYYIHPLSPFAVGILLIFVATMIYLLINKKGLYIIN